MLTTGWSPTVSTAAAAAAWWWCSGRISVSTSSSSSSRGTSSSPTPPTRCRFIVRLDFGGIEIDTYLALYFSQFGSGFRSDSSLNLRSSYGLKPKLRERYKLYIFEGRKCRGAKPTAISCGYAVDGVGFYCVHRKASNKTRIQIGCG
jgi:hypothetical protein